MKYLQITLVLIASAAANATAWGDCRYGAEDIRKMHDVKKVKSEVVESNLLTTKCKHTFIDKRGKKVERITMHTKGNRK
ncbi:hypothetical protein C9J01_10270 [Photobacterium rosenbergii]|uniref:Uncharacterized protein n=1 Tax=Photobacterium rosenbergii TaxID=294936 RepID=A0A2T3NFD9_9GAMM|nr:hypothetical protein [Photobacterium rosenbergii]PSW13231.1 hypothetical protein C9J01_10270 [Photobacterium rosenbergii]